LSEKIDHTSLGDTLKTVYRYPSDFQGNPVLGQMASSNMLDYPVTEDHFKNGHLLGGQENMYAVWGTGPAMIKLERTKVFKEEGPARETVYSRYDGKGNLTEVYRPDGTKTCYIWGYSGEYPIARIDNVSYGQIETHASTIVQLSDTDNDNCSGANCNEQLLRDALKDLREDPLLAGAMITTYTYDPLIGMTSMTDPKGNTTYFRYDPYARLKDIRDNGRLLLKDFKYNYQDAP
jgi:YD repeat-containing protein